MDDLGGTIIFSKHPYIRTGFPESVIFIILKIADGISYNPIKGVFCMWSPGQKLPPQQPHRENIRKNPSL